MRGGKIAAAMRLQDLQERIGPVLQVDDEAAGQCPGDTMPADGEQRLLAGRPHQADRLLDVHRFAQPPETVVGAIGQIRTAQESLEQTKPSFERIGTRRYRPVKPAVAASCAWLSGGGGQRD